jgi:hypothetical protein
MAKSLTIWQTCAAAVLYILRLCTDVHVSAAVKGCLNLNISFLRSCIIQTQVRFYGCSQQCVLACATVVNTAFSKLVMCKCVRRYSSESVYPQGSPFLRVIFIYRLWKLRVHSGSIYWEYARSEIALLFGTQRRASTVQLYWENISQS